MIQTLQGQMVYLFWKDPDNDCVYFWWLQILMSVSETLQHVTRTLCAITRMAPTTALVKMAFEATESIVQVQKNTWKVGGEWWDINGWNKTVSNYAFSFHFLHLFSFLFNPPCEMLAAPCFPLTGPLSKRFRWTFVDIRLLRLLKISSIEVVAKTGFRKLRNTFRALSRLLHLRGYLHFEHYR